MTSKSAETVSCAPSEQPESREDIALVLHRISSEMRYLSEEANHVESAIGATLVHLETPFHHTLQRADVLRQNLDGLENYINALIGTLSPGCTCASSVALAGLSLQAQIVRLSQPNKNPTENAELKVKQTVPEIWES